MVKYIEIQFPLNIVIIYVLEYSFDNFTPAVRLQKVTHQ